MKTSSNSPLRVFVTVVLSFFFFHGDTSSVTNCSSLSFPATVFAQEAPDISDSFDDPFDDDFLEDSNDIYVMDPLEPVNRFFFQVNDTLYFWLLKPVGRVYGAVIAEDFRICIRNAFNNILMPVRFVNNVLQGKFGNAGIEMSRFLINTTAGIAGFGDPAKDIWGLKAHPEDLGQTLGFYGIGNGIYFCWPILGPSTLRDTIGMAGDSYLDPLHYVMESDYDTGVSIQAEKAVNKTSLIIGDYESLIEASFDPYIALRDAYLQQRDKRVKDLK
ncbi:MAG: VacJ family lipoprotein [Desulfobulbaceae bacterium]|uniref:VacJ family lipoprotein n=1 Tax=Candidatus Desulfobia pelagia TaxID=2841692 RepID=A0A8J6NCY4_9BACT|nr:VacJ family lipoprotein [Candidatus Desulfobia pelagia]